MALARLTRKRSEVRVFSSPPFKLSSSMPAASFRFDLHKAPNPLTGRFLTKRTLPTVQTGLHGFNFQIQNRRRTAAARQLVPGHAVWIRSRHVHLVSNGLPLRRRQRPAIPSLYRFCESALGPLPEEESFCPRIVPARRRPSRDTYL